ncbi:MAG: ECF transporter S component [Eubacteriales bacterium]|nr:ECF transporter S component [Eubacteriales bacterium]MDD4475035.1 ECF transporter S component [Eubacteriales bacterium]
MKKNHNILLRLVTLSLLAAISIVLVSIIRIPMFTTYLEYEPADVPILIGGLMFGPAAGLLLTVVVSFIQALIFSSGSGFIGFIMHVIATGAMVALASLIYRKGKKAIENDYLRLIVALIVGMLTMTATMVPMNLLLTPIFSPEWTANSIWNQMMFTIIVPFNLVKSGINSAAAFVIYPIVERILKNSGKHENISA